MDTVSADASDAGPSRDSEADAAHIDATPPDSDEDGVPDGHDNCPSIANDNQRDLDADGLGDRCDADRDGDGRTNDADNCPQIVNPEQDDLDADGQGDRCDADDDGDGVDDADDNCPGLGNPNQHDRDADGLGDACDDFYRVGTADTVFQFTAQSNSAIVNAEFAGDINGDGFDDLIVTSAALGGGSSANYVFFGGPNRGRSLALDTADIQLVRNAAANATGDRAIGVGDVNADGFDDILVGERGAVSGLDLGDAFLVYGSPSLSGRIELGSADVIFDGEQNGDYAGGWLAAAGDVNGDGFDDMLIGAPWYTHQPDANGEYASAVYVVFGGAGLTGRQSLASADVIIRNTQISEYEMRTIVGVGDIDGDGLDDIAIGIPLSGSTDRSGDIHLFLGADLQPGTYEPTDGRVHLQGQFPSAQAGFSIAGGADFDGDGYDDLLIGAPNSGTVDNRPGRVYLVRGRRHFPTHFTLANQPAWVGAHPVADLGRKVAFVGDINGDGFDDALMGEPNVNVAPDTKVGAARLFFGEPPHVGEVSASEADVSVAGHTRLGDVGRAFDGGGDFDGDGVSDLVLIGRPPNSPDTTTTAAFVFYGPFQ